MMVEAVTLRRVYQFFEGHRAAREDRRLFPGVYEREVARLRRLRLRRVELTDLELGYEAESLRVDVR